ncbi:MAG TPA: glutamate-5-semialdehyde dehydrogenase [Thermoplasmata archaeon]|nr:glutamate-5-semialdehyde dehydrogenase [Thermoplasmata archaeon]
MDKMREVAQRSREASYRLQSIASETKDKALATIAERLKKRRKEIAAANRQDMARSENAGLASPLLKRLRYDERKLADSIRSIEALIDLEDPIGEVLGRVELDKGLILEKVASPIGVIAVIFESRPDALVQISTLCIKSGNAVILKGGSEAELTNRILARTISEAAVSVDKSFKDAVQLLSTREEVRELLALDDLVDLVIPRGSNELVRSIQEGTRIPVLGHAAGICHTYVHSDADVRMAVEVCHDAKCQYPAVCNAMETLLVHKDIAAEFLPRMAQKYRKAEVELRGDARTLKHIRAKKATTKDWSTEYNDLVLSIRIVDSLDDAIAHINRYGSHHTDAIITRSEADAGKFMRRVDSASVLWNCSTRFADGYRYGLGAEVGISTNKTHARGPVGLEGLVIYKYRLKGKGHVVADYTGRNAKRFTHRRLR